MKKYKDLCDYDFSDYAEEITGDALFKINGGAHIENSIEAQANAKVGDTVTREDGTTHTLYQGDIDWAQKEMAKKETKTPASGSSSSSSSQSSRMSNDGNIDENSTVPVTIYENSYGKEYRNKLDSTNQKFIYDIENKKINVKIDDKNALKKAAEVLSDLYIEGYTVNAIDVDGNIINFKSYSLISQFISSNNIISSFEDGNFSSWFGKQNGEPLTEREANIQRNFGIGEMVAGPIFSVGACEVTAGGSVLTGIYIMADGAVMIDSAEKGVKQQPGSFFTSLIAPTPVEVIRDIPMNIEIVDPSAIMPKWR